MDIGCLLSALCNCVESFCSLVLVNSILSALRLILSLLTESSQSLLSHWAVLVMLLSIYLLARHSISQNSKTFLINISKYINKTLICHYVLNYDSVNIDCNISLLGGWLSFSKTNTYDTFWITVARHVFLTTELGLVYWCDKVQLR